MCYLEIQSLNNVKGIFTNYIDNRIIKKKINEIMESRAFIL